MLVMAWIELSTTDILNSLTEAEQNQMAAAASAQSDLTAIVQSVTGLVRGKVNAAKRNQGHLGPPRTIPDELYAAAIAIARFKFLTHLPGTQLITADRRQDKVDAMAELEACAKGQLVVIRGDDVGDQSPIGIFAETGTSTLNPTLWPDLSSTRPGAQVPWTGDYW
jgi:hypothetical protein